MDVFTREAAVEQRDGQPGRRAGADGARRELRGHDRPGQQVRHADRELPEAVVDRGIQTLKKDLATRVARKGGQWSDHFERAAGAYNARPHETVYGAPENVEKQPATKIRLLQDNADKFQHNKDLTDVEDAGAFQAPTNAARSRGLHDRSTEGRETLLKLALPAPQGSGNAAGRLTRRGRPAVSWVTSWRLRGPGLDVLLHGAVLHALVRPVWLVHKLDLVGLAGQPAAICRTSKARWRTPWNLKTFSPLNFLAAVKLLPPTGPGWA